MGTQTAGKLEEFRVCLQFFLLLLQNDWSNGKYIIRTCHKFVF